jgi:hypothetical protein
MPVDTPNELEFHASGFIVKVHGTWTDKALDQFRHFLQLRNVAPSKNELFAVLQQAKEKYWNGQCRLSVCVAQPCRAKIGFDVSYPAIESFSREAGMPISLTGCQGPCKQAPVLSLRILDGSGCFAEVASFEDWHAILKFAQEARAAGTLMMDAGAAEVFRLDPVHDHPKPSVHLNCLQFLLGHFRGEGEHAMTRYRFHKELIGTREAGGRFIALRMGVSYPLLDGKTDVHTAFVIVGAGRSSGYFTAHAYTDAGLVREYSIEGRESELKFDDLPPGHEDQWHRARKILHPTVDGFEERLEVDGGQGFVPYYIISMRRVRGPSAA